MHHLQVPFPFPISFHLNPIPLQLSQSSHSFLRLDHQAPPPQAVDRASYLRLLLILPITPLHVHPHLPPPGPSTTPPLPSLKQHPPSRPKQHPPFSPKQHPPKLEKQHPPISLKQHPPLVLQQHPGASSSLASASASRAWNPGPGVRVGDIGGGGLYGCAWRGWCEAEEEEERRWARPGAGALEVADS